MHHPASAETPGHAAMSCDTRSHAVSSPSIGGSTRCRRRDSGQCPGPVPALACVASNGRVRSPGESSRAPAPTGATGEGKAERVNTSEPPRMPRYGNSPRRVVLARDDKERAAENRQAATGDSSTVVWTPLLPGYRWHPTRSYLMRVERGNPVRSITPHRRGGRPTAREAESRGGNRTPRKRMPAAERKQESGAICHRYLQPAGIRITGRIPGLVPGRESGLTCGG